MLASDVEIFLGVMESLMGLGFLGRCDRDVLGAAIGCGVFAAGSGFRVG